VCCLDGAGGHPALCRIFNLCSERAYDPIHFYGNACRYPFDDHNPPPLTLIPAFCAAVDSWLGAHPENVAAVHCKAGKGRTGCVIAAYLVHCGMFSDPDVALAFFGHRRTENGKGVTIPSQMRYVHYYSHMLHHGPSPPLTLQLQHVRFVTVPNMDGAGGCAPSFEVRVNDAKVFDYARSAGHVRRFQVPSEHVDLDLTAFDVRVRENVKIQFFHHP